MQNSDWPFPSKPHPASLGSGLMGNHGYRPHTSPPSFFPRERNWSEGVVGAVHIVTCLPLYPWSLSDHSIFIKLSITMHVLVPHSSPVARRGINEAQILLAASGWLFLFLHWTRPKNLWFASHKHKEWKEKKQKKQASFCWDVVAVFFKVCSFFKVCITIQTHKAGVRCRELIQLHPVYVKGLSLPGCCKSKCVPLTSASVMKNGVREKSVQWRRQRKMPGMTLWRWKTSQVALSGTHLGADVWSWVCACVCVCWSRWWSLAGCVRGSKSSPRSASCLILTSGKDWSVAATATPLCHLPSFFPSFLFLSHPSPTGSTARLTDELRSDRWDGSWIFMQWDFIPVAGGPSPSPTQHCVCPSQ